MTYWKINKEFGRLLPSGSKEWHVCDYLTQIYEHKTSWAELSRAKPNATLIVSEYNLFSAGPANYLRFAHDHNQLTTYAYVVIDIFLKHLHKLEQVEGNKPIINQERIGKTCLGYIELLFQDNIIIFHFDKTLIDKINNLKSKLKEMSPVYKPLTWFDEIYKDECDFGDQMCELVDIMKRRYDQLKVVISNMLLQDLADIVLKYSFQ